MKTARSVKKSQSYSMTDLSSTYNERKKNKNPLKLEINFGYHSSRNSETHTKQDDQIENKENSKHRAVINFPTGVDRSSFLENTLDRVVNAFSKLIGIKDPYTAKHQRQTAVLAENIAEKMGMTAEKCRGVFRAGMVHDLGKLKIPSEILKRPGELTDEEYNVIKSHPAVAKDILKRIPFQQPVAETVYQHHEHLDGSGYPEQIKEENILTGAKILTVADTYHALTSDRPYRSAHSRKAAKNILRRGDEIYDKQVVKHCLEIV